MPDTPLQIDAPRPIPFAAAAIPGAAALLLSAVAAAGRPVLGTATSVVLHVASLAVFVAAFVLLERRRRASLAALTTQAARVNDRLRNIVAVSPAGFYALQRDAQGGDDFAVGFIGSTLQCISGYAEQDWLSSPTFWLEHVHPDDRGQVLAAQARLRREGSVSHEYRFLCADGRYRWINDQLRLVTDADGAPVEIMGAWLDITDRRQAELTQQESERRYRTMFQANPAPMWVYDLDTLRSLAVSERSARAWPSAGGNRNSPTSTASATTTSPPFSTDHTMRSRATPAARTTAISLRSIMPPRPMSEPSRAAMGKSW